MHGFIDGGLADKIRDSLTSKICGSFIIFGNLVSGVLKIVIMVQIAKWVIHIILHGKLLYVLYGIGIALLGAIWDSITSYLVHQGPKRLFCLGG